MKAFAAHVKEFEVVYDKKNFNKRSSKTKWVKVVLQVPTSALRLALGVTNGLSRHMSRQQPRWLTVVDPFGPEMAVVRSAAHLLQCHELLHKQPNAVTEEGAMHALKTLLDAARELKAEPVIR